MSPASTRRVPLSLTVGGSPRDWGGIAGSVRIPFTYGVTIRRWRVHFQNVNPREGRRGHGSVRLSQIAIGESGGGGKWANAPRVIADQLRGIPKVSQWQHTPLLAGREYLLAYSWVSDHPTRRVVGGGWIASHPTDSNATLAHTRTQPLDAWIEAEVPVSTPVFAVFGDSLSSGVEATMPVRDSWPSIYAQRISALPIHYTASGDTMKSWSDPNHFKWRRWEHLTRPDYAIHAMGFNDIGNGASSWELQAHHLDTLEIMRDRLTDQVMLAAITPNNVASDERLGVRRSYNHWLAERRAPFIPFHMEVSHDDKILDAAFDVDGSHLNTEGYRLMASTVPSIPSAPTAARHTDQKSLEASPPARVRMEPISLTQPLGIRTETTTSRSCRIPFAVPREVHRWRVVIRNINYRANQAYSGQVNLRFIGYGTPARDADEALTSSFTAAPRVIARDTLVKDLSDSWEGPWISEQLKPGEDYMLALGYLTNGTPVTRSMGAGWLTSYSPSNAELTDDSSALPTNRIPFDIRIEVDSSTAPTEPYTADVVIGDSISAASDATFPILEAPAAVANRLRHEHTRLHTHGGTALSEWIGPAWGNPYSAKWQEVVRYGTADRALLALGNNDIHASDDLDSLQTNYLALVQLVRDRVAESVIACTVTPRAAWVGTTREATRQKFNNWLRSLPTGVDGVVDMARAVEAPGGAGPHPQLVSPDGIHFNSLGSAAMAATF